MNTYTKEQASEMLEYWTKTQYSVRFYPQTGSKRPWEVLRGNKVVGSCKSEESAIKSMNEWESMRIRAIDYFSGLTLI